MLPWGRFSLANNVSWEYEDMLYLPSRVSKLRSCLPAISSLPAPPYGLSYKSKDLVDSLSVFASSSVASVYLAKLLL